MMTSAVTPEGDPAHMEANYMGNDIQTSTPPAHEVDPHLVHHGKSSDSDEEHNHRRSYLPQGLPPVHGGTRSKSMRRIPMSSGMPMPGPAPLPPMSMPGQYSRLPLHPGHRRDLSMSMNMGMNMSHAQPPVHPVRRRSLSMGSDPRLVTAPPGHGVFIARLPFGIQPDDVLEAFSLFGPILGEADGIQVVT